MRALCTNWNRRISTIFLAVFLIPACGKSGKNTVDEDKIVTIEPSATIQTGFTRGNGNGDQAEPVEIRELAISADGTRLVVSSPLVEKKNGQLWDLSTSPPSKIAEFTGTRSTISPDGKTIAFFKRTLPDNGLHIQEVGGHAEKIADYDGDFFGPNWISLLPTGELVTHYDDTTKDSKTRKGYVLGLDAKTGKEIFKFSVGSQENPLRVGRPFAKGTRIASGFSNSPANVWQIPSGKLVASVATYAKARSFIEAVTGSSDGNRIAVSTFAENLRIFEVSSLNILAEIPLRTTGSEYATAFSNDGETFYYAGSLKERGYGESDSGVVAFNIAKKKPRGYFKGHTNEVVSLVVSEDGTVMATGSKDGTIKIWKLSDLR